MILASNCGNIIFAPQPYEIYFDKFKNIIFKKEV